MYYITKLLQYDIKLSKHDNIKLSQIILDFYWLGQIYIFLWRQWNGGWYK